MHIIPALQVLLRNPTYLGLSLFLSIFLFVIYFILNNFEVFTSAAAINTGLLWVVFTNQVKVVWEVGGALNVSAVALVSLLAGINITLTILRKRATKVFIGRANLFTLFGSFGGAFGAACSACNTSLIALLGVTGGLAFFPFQGLEISIVSIVILTISLYYTSKSLFEMGVIK